MRTDQVSFEGRPCAGGWRGRITVEPVHGPVRIIDLPAIDLSCAVAVSRAKASASIRYAAPVLRPAPVWR